MKNIIDLSLSLISIFHIDIAESWKIKHLAAFDSVPLISNRQGGKKELSCLWP